MNIGVFGIEARLDRLTDNGDILPTLDALVPWEVTVHEISLSL